MACFVAAALSQYARLGTYILRSLWRLGFETCVFGGGVIRLYRSPPHPRRKPWVQLPTRLEWRLLNQWHEL